MIKKALRDIVLKNSPAIAAGTVCELTLDGRGISAKIGGRVVRLGYRNAKVNFGAPFTKQPSLATLEKWGDSGIARSVTGARVEMDGYGPDNAPSWALIMGLI